MALKFPDRLESNNPEAYGIIRGDQIAGSSLIKISSDTSPNILYSDITDEDSVFGKEVLFTSSNKLYRHIRRISECEKKDNGNVIPHYFDYCISKSGISFGKTYVRETEYNSVLPGIKFWDENNDAIAYSLSTFGIKFGTKDNLSISTFGIKFCTSNLSAEFTESGIIFIGSDNNLYLSNAGLELECSNINKNIKLYIGTYSIDQQQSESLISIDNKFFITNKGIFSTWYDDNAIFGNNKILLPISTAEIDNLFK